MHIVKKNRLMLLLLLFSFTQNGISETLRELMKTKTLIVVIPDEEEKIFSNFMDAVEDYWKYCPYKFMNIKDAKTFYSKSDFVFLQLVTVSTTASATSGTLTISLKQGRKNSKEDINRLLPLSAWQLSTKNENISCSLDQIPAEATQRMYFFAGNFINSMEAIQFDPTSREENVAYTCAKDQIQSKKNIISQKNVLLIDKNDISPTDSVDRVPILRQNLNKPDLKVVIVEFQEIDMALRKKESNTMVAVNGKIYSCNNFEVLCLTPLYDAKELKGQQRHQSSLKIFGWVIGIGALVGTVVYSEFF
jgi:hypothetical protein